MSDASREPRKAAWRRDDSEFAPAAPTERRTVAKSRKLYFLVAVSLGLLGVLLAAIEYLRPTPPPKFVSLTVREYAVRDYRDLHLPPNAFAVQDGQRLSKHFQDVEGGLVSDTRTVFETKLSGSDKAPLVVYLNALAYVREAAAKDPAQKDESDKRSLGQRIIVLPADARAGEDDSKGIPFSDILDRLQARKGSTPKLLILDIMHPIANARLGIATDQVAEATQDYLAFLEKETPDKGKLPCFVLTACSAGQLSLISGELRASIFAYYVEEGVKGYADGFGEKGRRDGLISVHELADFVKFRVSRWAWMNRRTVQTPRLFGGDLRDFSVSQFDPARLVAEEEKLADLKYPDWLKAGWDLADAWSTSHLYRQLPHTFIRLRLDLMRAESKWNAGFEEDRVKTDLGPTVDEATRELKAFLALPPVRLGTVRPAFLQTAEAVKRRPDLEAIQKSLVNFLPRALEPKDKFDEAEKKILEELNKTKKDLLDRLKKQPAGEAVGVLFGTAASVPNLSPGKLLVLLDLLSDLKADHPLETRLHESLQLERLAELWKTVQEYGSDWPTNLVNRSLQLGQQANETLALLAKDPGALEFVQADWNRAEKHRRDGEIALFGGRMSQWKNAEPNFRDAEALYREVATNVRAITLAREAWESAATLLPSVYGPSAFLGRWEPGPSLETGLNQAASNIRQLVASFQPSEKRSMTEFDLAKRLTRNLDGVPTLTEHHRKKWKAGENFDPEVSHWMEMNALLTLPTLTAANREFLFAEQHKLAKRLHKLTRERDDEENDHRPIRKITLGDDLGVRHEAFRTQLRLMSARLTLEAADALSAITGDAKLSKGISEPKSDGAFLQAFARFYNHGVPEMLRSAKATDVQKDALSRIFPDLDYYELKLNPAKKLRDAQLQRFRNFHIDRYQKETAAWTEQSTTLAKSMAEIAEAMAR